MNDLPTEQEKTLEERISWLIAHGNGNIDDHTIRELAHLHLNWINSIDPVNTENASKSSQFMLGLTIASKIIKQIP